MIKHGVVMVTLLILTLSLLGVVSASDDITASDVDSQLSLNQEYSQIEVNSYEDTSSNDFSSSSDAEVMDDALLSADSISFDVETATSISAYDGKKAVSVSYYESAGENECDSPVYIETGNLSLADDLKIQPNDVENGLCDNYYEFSYNLTAGALDTLNFESGDEILVIEVVGSEISDVTAEYVLNGIIDASNGYITYTKGNLLKLSSIESDLIDFAFFIKKGESLTMAFYKYGTLTPVCSGNVGSEISASLWNDLQMLCSGENHSDIGIDNFGSNGCLKDVLNRANQKYLSLGLLFGQDMIQTLLEYGHKNDIVLPNDSGLQILGASKDSDDNAFIWSMSVNPDKNAYVSVDSIKDKMADIGYGTSKSRMITVMSYDQSNFKEMTENNLNPDGNIVMETQRVKALTSEDIKQIGIDASNKALAYFKSQGIDVNKDYHNFYILTSAGYAKLDGLDTADAISGIYEVFGLKIENNVLSVDTPLWKDLVFYFLWVNGADTNDIVSYALVYAPLKKQLVESQVCKKQGDEMAYKLGLYGHNPPPKPPAKHYPPRIHHGCVVYKEASALSNLTNVTNKTANVTNATGLNKSNVNKSREVKKPLTNKGSPYNILYNLAAICIIFAVFGTSYSKR